MLPQQTLMLTVAAEALADARWDRDLGPRTGVVIGLGLDQNTNNYQLRWWIPAQASRWNTQLGLGLSEVELDGWIDALRNAVGPALTANRTMGSLGGLVASRIAPSSGSAAPALPSLARRPREHKPCSSPADGSIDGSSMRSSSVRSTCAATCARAGGESGVGTGFTGRGRGCPGSQASGRRAA